MLCVEDALVAMRWLGGAPAAVRRSRENLAVVSRWVDKTPYDIGSYVEAPPGLRLWGGATVEARDLDALTPWLDWAYAQVRNS